MSDTLQLPTSHAQKCRPTIVCIDDDPDIPAAVALMLSKFDVKVIPAFTGQQGIWEVLSASPDLVITDCKMPQGGGDEVLECLKSLRKTWCVPIVVLTGLRDSRLEGHMRRLGAAGHLRKPVSPAQLLAEIQKLLELRERDAGPEPAR
jgi:DNA-binding response OmpR family regulator